MHKKMKLSENIAIFENGLAEAACFTLENYTLHEIENNVGKQKRKPNEPYTQRPRRPGYEPGE